MGTGEMTGGIIAIGAGPDLLLHEVAQVVDALDLLGTTITTKQ
jgi:hypothetical protein